jgi:5-methylcytosine-specific restriction endonuclease McrA
MVRTLIDFAPAELALAPRPLEGELTSSWLYRVAAANLVEVEELLSALLDLYPEVHSRSNICLDYGIAPAWSRALAIWCRLAESRIDKLDLARVFPGRHLNLFVHGNGAFSSGRDSGGGSVWWMAFIFCPRCLDQQGQRWPAGTPTCRMDAGVLDSLPATPRRTATSLLSLLPSRRAPMDYHPRGQRRGSSVSALRDGVSLAAREYRAVQPRVAADAPSGVDTATQPERASS